MTPGRRASLHTLGCRLNQAETAVLADSLSKRGYEIVPMGQPTDVVIVNSCSVTLEAEADCRRLVRAVMRRDPSTLVAITGCYAQVGSAILKELDGVDLIVGTEDKQRLPEILETEYGKRAEAHVIRSRPGKGSFEQPGAGLYLQQTRANLKIQDGCNVGCSFCIIPQTRGAARSRHFDDIVREARALLESGHRELVITGVNLGSYLDADRNFVDLLAALEPLDGLQRLRISSIEPSTVTDELLHFMAAHRRICRYLHIPIQSGCNATLQRMRRPTTRQDLDDVFERTQRILPQATLGTDVMVGFPGEDEAAFARTQELLTNAGLSYLHVFSYSPRPGTRATRLADQVPRAVVKERSRKLHDIDRRLRQRWAAAAIGRDVEVLLEQRKPQGHWLGLTDQFHRVAIPDTGSAKQRPLASNQMIRVRVVEHTAPYLWGEAL